ncbi:MAG: URC4/urg3 family protein [Phormidesmis sp. RL_2_1]|nr:URC4/urg3 family protein [Phormidesmis sp. RL_2_1]
MTLTPPSDAQLTDQITDQITDQFTDQLTDQSAIAYLQQPKAIRDRANQLFQLAQANQLEHFCCNLGQLDHVAAYVVETTQQAYPDFVVPFHSRWRHFEVGGVPRLAKLHQALSHTPAMLARAQIDLAIVSVLLDAGAGSQWRYVDTAKKGQPQQTLGRSEGLAVASLRAFEQGLFSSAATTSPYQVDAVKLQQLSLEALAKAFQVTDQNPLVGLRGRLALLQQLGKTLANQGDRFGQTPARPSNLLDYWTKKAIIQQATIKQQATIDAGTLLSEVLQSFGSIWPGRIAIAHTNLGDVWPHPSLPRTTTGSNLVPFHKLSQWLTYSLVEPLAIAGVHVTNLDALTGLAEYRNGGLCVDLGLLVPKHSAVTDQAHRPSSSVVVEWRALTIVMLDLIGDRVRQRLNLSPADLPLIKVLEGGTWAAGRRIAKQLRPTGAPPITLQSDGTVF